MRLYIYIGLAVAVLAALAFGYAAAYKSGKQSVVTKLQEDKIVVLQEGKRIDERVLSSDDESLICFLVECDAGKKQP